MKYIKKDLDLENLTIKKQGGKYLVSMLQNLYCSCQSEVSCFLLFNFQHLVLKNSNKDFSNLLQNFSQESLRNSALLGEYIIEYGGLPFYINSQNSPLNAFWLEPETDLQKIKIIGERFLTTLLSNYNTYKKKISDKKILKLIDLLIEKNTQMLAHLQSTNI